MNNKDLFNAINDIDEKFIEDAAKYLNDEDSDDPLHPKAVEIFPGEARFPVIKLVASIAAAAVFITGVTFAVKHYRDKMGISPNAASDTYQDPDLGTHPVKTNVGQLPFKLIGPDEKQIWYEDITGFQRKDSIAVNDSTNIIELSEDNWDTITLGFAYYALPNWNNYNSVDNSEMDLLAEPSLVMSRDFKRIYAGNTYGDLTVKKAYSKLTRDTYYDKVSDLPHEVAYLSSNYIEFDGETTAEVYIVNDGGNYCCVFRSGAENFPIVGYDMPNYLEGNGYYSKLSTLDCENGFKYSGDMPVMWLDEEEVALVESALSNANYLKATVTFSNVTLTVTQNLAKSDLDINADIARIDLKYVDPVVTTDNMFGETPFTADTEMQLRTILGSAESISELTSNAAMVKNLTDCADIRVYKGIANMAGIFGEEIFEGSITPGMVIVLRNSDGEQIAAYKCRELPE